MLSKNKELKDAIADANSDSQNEKMLREKLEYYICKYNAERCARISLQNAYGELVGIVEQQKRHLLISRLLSTAGFVLSLIALLL